MRIAKKDFTRFRNDFVLFSKILPLGVFACDTKAVDKRPAVSETRDVYADFLRTLCPRGHSTRTVFVFYRKCLHAKIIALDEMFAHGFARVAAVTRQRQITRAATRGGAFTIEAYAESHKCPRPFSVALEHRRGAFYNRSLAAEVLDLFSQSQRLRLSRFTRYPL